LAQKRLSEERSGFDLDSETKAEVETLIVPLIKAGQSLSQIYLTHYLEIPFTERSLRSYIHAGVFAQLSDFDLKRKVRYRPRKKRDAKVAKDIPKHSYADFIALPAEVQASTTEMDTVIGRVGGKALLTLFMRNCSLMIIFLLEACDQSSVIEALSLLHTSCICAEYEFYDIFTALLSDRGSEFGMWQLLETLGQDDEGNIQTPFFYCDPKSPEQRAASERNHTYIREYLSKGSSFDDLTEEDVSLMSSHINSIPRASLGARSPWQLAEFLYGRKWLNFLGISFIEPDNVIRKPYLLGR
jgi:IS30 family transposase